MSLSKLLGLLKRFRLKNDLNALPARRKKILVLLRALYQIVIIRVGICEGEEIENVMHTFLEDVVHFARENNSHMRIDNTFCLSRCCHRE